MKKSLTVLIVSLFAISILLADDAAPAKQADARSEALAVRRDAPTPPEPKPFLGIIMEAVGAEDAQKAGAPEGCVAVKIAGVNKDSAAEKAGLKVGDLVFGVEENGRRSTFVPKDANTPPQALFVQYVADKKPGDKLTICILRDGKEIVLTIVLGERPVFNMQAAEHPELSAAGGGKSLVENFLAENELTKDYLATANMLYAASNMVQGSTFIVEGKPDFFRLKEVTYLLRNPEDTAALSEAIADSVEAAFNKDRHDLGGLIKTAGRWLDEPVVAPVSPKLSGNAADIDTLMGVIETAMKMRAEALAKLSADDRKAIEAMRKDFTETDTGFDMLAALRAISKIDFRKLYAACAYFAQVADQFEALQKCGEAFRGKSAGKVPGVTGEVLLFKHTKYGDIIVGGAGDNVYTADAAIIIDIGGNDVYRNNAGGTFGETYFALCADFGGDDVYVGERSIQQGAAMLGCGILIDTEGDDTYRAGYFSQGYGLMGVGLLVDLSGDDTYRARNHAQGAAWFGIGVLAEGAGLDSYHADNFAQGLGQCKGFGAVVETSGNDAYYLGGAHDDQRAPGRSYTSMGQGFGFGSRPYQTPFGTSGGIGLLADAEGHDRYVGDYFCQGSSYWYALGILRDGKGNDHYFCGRYSQGAGIHLSLGALVDCAGDDSYIAYFGVSQGCGHDWAYGILEDKAGDDYYQAKWLSQGAGNDCGMGVLFDHKGDDRYVGERDVQGHGSFNQARNAGSVGIFMDLDGKDEYISPTGSADGKVFKKDTRIGLFFDMPAEKEED